MVVLPWESDMEANQGGSRTEQSMEITRRCESVRGNPVCKEGQGR